MEQQNLALKSPQVLGKKTCGEKAQNDGVKYLHAAKLQNVVKNSSSRFSGKR